MTQTATRPSLTGLIAAVILLNLAASSAGAEDWLRPLPLPQGEWVVEVTAVQPGGPAYRAGLEVRDRILEVDGTRVSSLPQLHRLLQSAGYSARLTILNRQTGREATVYVYPEDGRIGIDGRVVLAFPFRRYPY